MSPPPTSVNGSSATGNCSNYANGACNDPASSVLFDGHIPTLTGLDGDTWASQLLTIQEPGALILFDFTDTPNYTGVEAVEVVSFSCLEWGLTTRDINLAVNPSNLFVVAGQLINTDTRSCEHLVRYCIQGESVQRVLILQFNFISTKDWLHLAEVRFHINSSACPHDTIITPPPPPTTTPPPATTSPPSLGTTNTSQSGNNTPKVPNNSPQITSTTSTNPESTDSTGDELPNIILIAVPASVAFFLLLAVFTVAILIICKCKHHKPNTSSLTSDMELEKYAPVSGDKPPLPGGGEAGASALHVQVYTEVNIVNHPTQTHQETESGMDQLYDQVDIKTNIRRVPPSAVTTDNIVSQYSELQASDPVDQLYAQVDKKKGKKKKHGVGSQPSATPSSQAADMVPSEPVDQLYAQVDKKQKGKKKKEEPADSHSSETIPSQPHVMELYAQVDKKKKRKKKTTDDSEPPYSEPPAELYAQVDKKRAKQGSSATGDSQYVETESQMDQLYAQVDKKRKSKKKSKEDKVPETAVDQLYAQVDKKKQKKSKEKEVCPEESGAVYSVVNKPSPPQVPTKSQQLLEETG